MKKFVAEFIGTLMLVFFGCGTAVLMTLMVGQGAGVVAIALAFGLVLMAMVYAFGSVSGCHINPAVSLGMLITGRMSIKDFFVYIVAQFAGGIAGAGILYLIFTKIEVLASIFQQSQVKVMLGANGYGDASSLGIALWIAILVEVILTFVFVYTVLGATDKIENKAVAGLAVGLTLTLVHILGIPFTGTSVNPARSLGPAIFTGGEALGQVWVFIVAPLIGAVLAALLYKALSPKAKEESQEEAQLELDGATTAGFEFMQTDAEPEIADSEEPVLDEVSDEAPVEEESNNEE